MYDTSVPLSSHISKRELSKLIRWRTKILIMLDQSISCFSFSHLLIITPITTDVLLTLFWLVDSFLLRHQCRHQNCCFVTPISHSDSEEKVHSILLPIAECTKLASRHKKRQSFLGGVRHRGFMKSIIVSLTWSISHKKTWRLPPCSCLLKISASEVGWPLSPTWTLVLPE